MPLNTFKSISDNIVNWFQTNARDLPWRRTSDPYAIWVSEIMLQQTQVKTVIPYWTRWMAELPKVQSLAEARLEKILKLWEGLGYYRRARAMHKAANVIMEKHGGKFPTAYEDVLDLPGIGPYTAGAICSIAYGQPTPIVDGNIIRLISRLERIQKPVDEAPTRAKIWKLSERLVQAAAELKEVQGGKPCSDLNQGLMELGATVCIPGKPLCQLCPLQPHCKAFKQGNPEKYPKLGARMAYTSRTFIAFIIEKDGKVLIRQRQENVVNGGLWEFPNWEVKTGEERRELLINAGLSKNLLPITAIHHTITRYRITLEVFRASSNSFTLRPQNSKWKTPEAMAALPFSSAHGKIVKLVASSK